MAHHSSRSVYDRLTERLNRFPQGAPPSEQLFAILDNRLLWSHRALAALLGVVLKLPPAQRLLATKQVRSRYLEALARRFE